MTEPVTGFLFGAKEMILGLIAAIVGLLGFSSRRVIKRVDHVEDELAKKVGRQEYQGTINRVSGEIASTREEMRENHTQTILRMDKVLERLSEK